LSVSRNRDFVLLLPELDLPDPRDARWDRWLENGAVRMMEFVKYAVRHEEFPRDLCVTLVSQGEEHPIVAAMAGFLRSLIRERSGLHLRHIHFAEAGSSEMEKLTLVRRELTQPLESLVRYTARGREVAELEPLPTAEAGDLK